MAIVFASASPNVLLHHVSLIPSSSSFSRALKLQASSHTNWANSRLLNAAAQTKTAAVELEQEPTLELEQQKSEQVREEEEEEENFTEVGVVIRKHGIHGELLIKSFTDFPEEHFENPGIRWMSFYERGRQRLQRVELLKGRISVGKVPCWLISFKDVNTPEEAAFYIGATMVVKREDGPALEEREFNVSRPSRVLKVPTPSNRDLKDEARREALRARRKLQERKSGLKKSLAKTKQEHLLEGLSTGEEEEQTKLLNELLETDFKAVQAGFEKAMKKPESRLGGFTSLPQRFQAGKDWIKDDSYERIQDAETEVQRWWRQGLKLIANKKVAVACTIDSEESVETLRFHAQRLSAAQRAANAEFPDRTCEIFWFIFTKKESVEPVSSMIHRQKFFGLKQSQIRVSAQETIPCFEAKPEDENHKILQASPWKLVEALSGDGGALKALITQGFVDDLEKKGVRYLQVVDGENSSSRIGDPVFFGFSQAQKSDMSIQMMSRAQPGEPVIGFSSPKPEKKKKKKSSDGELELELVYSKTPLELLFNGGTPLGSSLVSVEFAKRLQDQGYKFQMEIGEQDEDCIRLKYSILDCLSMIQERKVLLLEVKHDELDSTKNLQVL